VGRMMLIGLFRRPVVRRLVSSILCSAFAAMYLAGTATASAVTFGTPSATSKFGTGITFTQPYSGSSIKSASILLDLPNNDAGPVVASVTTSGSSTLAYALTLKPGALMAFSPVAARFEVTLADGTTQDGPEIKIVYADDRFTWKSLTGKVVRLHYVDASASLAKRMLDLADAGVTKGSTLFGVAESAPIDCYVYPDAPSFLAATGVPGTAGGTVDEPNRLCYDQVSPGDPTGYAPQVMPHETAHVVFWDGTHNPYHRAPTWVNEGLVQYVSVGYDTESRQNVAQAVKDGTLSSLLGLGVNWPSIDSTRFRLAYSEALSAVDFMIRQYGQPSIAALVKAYAAADTDDEAFKAAFGVDVAGFDAAWQQSLGAHSTQYGPQPAPTGPLPPGWSTSGGPNGTNGPTPTSAPGTPSNRSGGSSNQTVFVIAGLMAVVGVALVGASIYLAFSTRR
jgi:hypothetical protein